MFILSQSCAGGIFSDAFLFSAHMVFSETILVQEPVQPNVFGTSVAVAAISYFSGRTSQAFFQQPA